MPLTGEAKRQYQLEWMHKRRNAWIESQGAQCAACGSVEDLEVDHIDPDLKTMNPAKIWSRREEVRTKELANCQVLCSDCHKGKTAKERADGIWHGSAGMYERGCKCFLCMGYMRNSKRASRAGMSIAEYKAHHGI